ncbi:MAG: LLM class F420-dependent oxidoreductase [Ilumatobacteraceae bacterium]|jgi:probable F420-dependent oxidoreductase
MALTKDSLGKLGLWTFQLDMQPMREAQKHVARLEELGFRTVWVPEAVGREPFASTSLLLSATDEMILATGIASLYARSPMTMQAGWKTVTEAFPDRFLLGIGVSHQPAVEGFHGGTYDKPLSAMKKYLDAMDNGFYFAAQPTSPPARALAALGPKMLQLSAERSLGAHPYFVPVEHTTVAREALGPDALLAPEQAVVFSKDADEARSVARGFMKTYLGLPNYTNNLKRLGWTDDDLSGFDGGPTDRLVDAIVAWGTLDDIAMRIQDHLARGADHVCVQVLSADPRKVTMSEFEQLSTLIPSL